MKNMLLATVVAAIPGFCMASAPARFDLAISSGQGWYYTFSPNQNPAWVTNWSGGLEVVTSSSADGTYSGEDLQLVDYHSNYDSFIYTAGSAPLTGGGFNGPITEGMAPGASVTILDGKVVSLDFTYDTATGGYQTFSGLSLQDFNSAGIHYADTWSLQAVMTPVPEPTSGKTLLIGLAALAGAVRIKRAARSEP